VSSGPRCSHGFADRRSFSTRGKGRWVSWILHPSRSAPVPLEASPGNSRAGPSNAPPAPSALLPGSLSARPVHLGRPSPPLWHGPLPGVVGQCEICCLADDARPQGRTREVGRVPHDGGRHGCCRSSGGDAHWPRPPLALCRGGERGRRVPGGTPHRVPAGGGRGRPYEPAGYYRT